MTWILLIIGLALVVLGADWLVDGASAVARRLKISEFVIGLTIVGFGTSMPELVVSLTGAFKGLSDIAVGNVIGSNTFNILLILGLTALLSPVSVSDENRKRDIPITFSVTVITLVLGYTGKVITLTESIVMLALFAAYLYYCFKSDKVEEEADSKVISLPFATILIAVGLGGLIFGGRMFVENAVTLARQFGVSEKFIALTILAGGTSMPELVTCIVATIKKKDQLALGNILGSNVFNLLLILGCSGLVMPVSFAGIDTVDAVALVASVVIIWLASFLFKKKKIDRAEGLIMLLAFASYYIWLFEKA